MAKNMDPLGLKGYLWFIFKMWLVMVVAYNVYLNIEAGGRTLQIGVYIQYPMLIGFAVGWWLWKGQLKPWIGIFDGLEPSIMEKRKENLKKEHIAQTKKDLKMFEMMDVENVVIKSSCKRNGEKIPLKDAKNPICDECQEKKPFHCNYVQL